MDDTDKMIINEVQADSGRRVSDIASKLNLPRSTVNNRLNRLHMDKIILRDKAVIDMKKTGRPICALVHIVITSKESVHEVASRLRKRGNIEEIYILAGQFDILIKVRLKDMEELSKFIFDSQSGLRSWPSVERTESMIVLDTVKENGVILI